MESYLSLSNRHSFHDELVERVRSYSSLLLLILVDPVRCGLIPFCLVDVLFSFSRFPPLLWRVDQWKVKPVSLLVFWFFVLKLLYACTYLTVAFLWFSQ